MDAIVPLSSYATDDLETLLNKLCGLGVPRLNRMSHGWYCAVEMHVRAKGCVFEVKSEFDHPTALKAAQTTATRAIDVVKQFS